MITFARNNKKLTAHFIGITVLAVLFIIFQPQIVSSGDNLFKQLKVFTTVLQLVRANYVEEVDSEDLVEGAIVGMLDRLDPHTSYLDASSFTSLTERHVGEYSGIGISFAIRDGYLTVISPIEGSPSDRLGIRAGDRIVRIEGRSAIGIKETEVFEQLRGRAGTTVHVSVQREGEEELLEFDITRENIAIKSVPYYFFLRPGLGYVRAIRFSAETSTELETALRELEEQAKRAAKGMASVSRVVPPAELEEDVLPLAAGTEDVLLLPAFAGLGVGAPVIETAALEPKGARVAGVAVRRPAALQLHPEPIDVSLAEGEGFEPPDPEGSSVFKRLAVST